MKDSVDDPIKNEETKAKERTMNISIKEGSFAGISLTFGDNYIIPFALALQASSAQVGVLSSLVGIVSPTAQILGSRMMEKYSRRQILTKWVFLQALMWLSFLFLGILFVSNVFISSPWGKIFVNNELISFLPILLIIFYMTYLTFGNIAGPVWFCLMGDIVPEDHRGRYFAKRNLITTAIALTATILVSLVLDYYKALGNVLIGFYLIFITGLICRSVSAKFFTIHYYPPFNLEKSYYVSLWKFIKEIPKENFGRFTLYVTLINFGQMIAGPFFSVYMLQDLGFDYATYIIINLSATFMGLLFFPLLGKFSDKYGNIQMLRISSIMLPIIPLLWILLNTPIQLILGPQIISGIGWTAFNLAASNFIYDSVPSQKRGLYVAYYNFLLGIGIVCGGLLGSFFISFLQFTFIKPFHFVFLISGIVRAIVIIILLLRIKEVRKVPGIKSVLYFRHFNVHKWLYENFGTHVHSHKQKNNKNGQ